MGALLGDGVSLSCHRTYGMLMSGSTEVTQREAGLVNISRI